MRSWLIFLVLLATGAWAQVYPGYPGTVPPAYPGYPGTVPPAYPGYPGAVPPTYPGYPGSVPPAYPGYPGAVPSTYPGYPGSLPQTTPGYPGTMPAAAPQDLWLYGGKGHQVLLGGLTASKLAPESVWNSYGRYGSSFNDDSIWNQFGTYGSEFSAVSPWNQFGTDPPVVVDKAGHVMGDFTVNQLDAHRTQVPSLLYILNNFRDFRTNLDTYRASMP